MVELVTTCDREGCSKRPAVRTDVSTLVSVPGANSVEELATDPIDLCVEHLAALCKDTRPGLTVFAAPYLPDGKPLDPDNWARELSWQEHPTLQLMTSAEVATAMEEGRELYESKG